MKLGDTMTYERPGRQPVVGRLIAVRLAPGIIHDRGNGDRWPGVQFQLAPLDGTPPVWTITYPDKEHRYTHPVSA